MTVRLEYLEVALRFRAGRLPVVHTREVKDELDLNDAQVMTNLCALRSMAAVRTGDGWGFPRGMPEEP